MLLGTIIRTIFIFIYSPILNVDYYRYEVVIGILLASTKPGRYSKKYT